MISRCLDLHSLLEQNVSALLVGPRGTGKTVLSEGFLSGQALKGRKVVHIDLLSLRQQSRYIENPHLFRADIDFHISSSDSAIMVLIDEVQKAPQLLDEVHHFLEKERARCQFLMTGSSARKLKQGGANLLAGRAISLHLHPLSLLDTPLSLDRVLQYGSLPRFYLETEQTELLLEAYVDTYLKEEIQAERLVRRLEPFHRFLSVAAQMNGKAINYSSIARELRISDQTVRDYFAILCDTLVAFELPAWSRSVRQQLAHASRFYFFDCGVLNAILGEQGVAPTASTRRYGYLFENFVVGEFFRQNDYLRTRRNLFAWRLTSGKEEVDIIIDRGLHLPPIAVEIKSAEVITVEDLRGLKAFQLEFPEAPLYCVCRSQSPYRLDGVTVLPWETGITEILKKSIETS